MPTDLVDLFEEAEDTACSEGPEASAHRAPASKPRGRIRTVTSAAAGTPDLFDQGQEQEFSTLLTAAAASAATTHDHDSTRDDRLEPPVVATDTSGPDVNQIPAPRPTGSGPAHVAPPSELTDSAEFISDLQRIADCMDQEAANGLAIGRIACKWIDNRKYHRVLNPARFAELLKRHTGRERSRKDIENYVKAYRVHESITASGKRFPLLGVSHLAQIARCQEDGEWLELATRANDQQATVKQIPQIAAHLHAERVRAERTFDISPTVRSVQVLKAVDLVNEQVDGSISCLMLDWQWAPVTWGGHADFPAVHCSADPVDDLCECLRAAAPKLTPDGLIYIFYTSVGLLDRRIEDAWQQAGFRHASQLIWQKACGAFIDLGTPLAVAHEHVHILCHKEANPKSACGYASSVTPKWAAPTNAHSGQQRQAVHPHQKPVELMEYLISIATVNGLVVDPYAGSGSCGVAAVRRGCGYVGAELVPEYARIANERIALACGEVDQVTDAITFFLNDADGDQRTAITRVLSKAGLDAVPQHEEKQ